MNPTREAAGKETPHAAFGGWTLLLALGLAWLVVLLSGCRDSRSAGPDAAVAAETLHDAVAASTPDAWRDELHLGVGRPGFILARQGIRLAQVDDRVRDALRAAREASVRIARRAAHRKAKAGESVAVLEETTRRMHDAGWERAVTVLAEGSLVVVFVPTEWPEGPDVACSVLVQDRAQMVIVAAVVSRDRVEHLAEQLQLPDGMRHLALAK